MVHGQLLENETGMHRCLAAKPKVPGWRSTKMAVIRTVEEFEQRQLRAILAEVKRAHVERVAPVAPKQTTPVRKLRADQ